MSAPDQNDRRGRRSIRGPQSALTDYLASHNISARAIHDENQRRAAAAAADQGDAEAGPSTAAPDADENGDDPEEEETTETKKRKRNQKAAIAKIKASKKFQKQKKKQDIGSDDSEEEADLIKEFMRASVKLPGQMENCEICGTRFTVTPYSRSGPDGGLLCNPCGKELDKNEAANKKPRKKPTTNGNAARRRQMASNLLDGKHIVGSKSLTDLCIQTLVRNIDLADDLGDLPPRMIDKIARILSKKRMLDPNTLSLFLQPKTEDVFVYDAAKLTSDDFLRILREVPNLKFLKIRCGIQFKDEIMDYLISRDSINLESFSLHGANLLSDKAWTKFLTAKGSSLRELKVYYTDNHFGDEMLKLLTTTTPDLRRLKVEYNQKVTPEGIMYLSRLKQLEHLTLQLHHKVHPDIYVDLLGVIGSRLKTFSICDVPEMNNTVLDAIHTNCRSLQKLRINDSEEMTDAGFVRLFKGWRNPGLDYIDLKKCRQMDSANPRENPEDIGLCSNGFEALMKHSGQTLRRLNIMACRNISAAAFEKVFGQGREYPELRLMEISFCEEVTDFIVGSIFRTCPSLQRLVVFGCMKVKDVQVPKGRILIGVPNAFGMQMEGF